MVHEMFRRAAIEPAPPEVNARHYARSFLEGRAIE